MARLLQQYIADFAMAHNVFFGMVQNEFWYTVFQVKLYVKPTLRRRLGVDQYGGREFAYQKAESRFDIYSVRAIIRDERF